MVRGALAAAAAGMVVWAGGSSAARAASEPGADAMTREIFQQLIEINTTESAAPLSPEVMNSLDALVGQMWPGIKVVPSMAAGASDAVYTNAAGIPTYLILGVAVDKGDDRAHGRDERLGVQSFYRGNEFFSRYVKAISSE